MEYRQQCGPHKGHDSGCGCSTPKKSPSVVRRIDRDNSGAPLDALTQFCCQCVSAGPSHHFYYCIDFCKLALVLCCLPFCGLLICLLIAVIWQADKVNDTMCKVDNFIPSISAITSISPQRYIWRICISLHAGPRLVFGFAYYKYFLSRANLKSAFWSGPIFRWLLKGNIVLYVVETAGLVGTTYISNIENYPVHEKLFITYMTSSILYMINTCIIFSISRLETKHSVVSLRMKMLFLAIVLVSTVGLLYFFFQHRWYCTPGAFSWFSFCEYWIAFANIAYHTTAYWDFHDHQIVIGNANNGTSPNCAERSGGEKEE